MQLLLLIFASILVTLALGRAMRCSSDSDCSAPLSCVGNPTNMQCRMKKGVGMSCGKDPFWVCQDGLTCDSNICRGLMDVGEECSSPFECMAPYICAGRPSKQRCVKPMPIGGRCGRDPKWVCERGLKCRFKICVRTTREVGGSCNGITIICGRGRRCAGNPGDKKCFRRRTEGETCGTPFEVCNRDLRCMGNVCVPVSV